ncbi:protein FAM13C isoform X2 [Nasonia vitripennis]|uniref:Rho-GAP domain-containing protein n=1 Tax=Nasonia vitripennis TaxID=7425 RepID=A0A7M7H951_NASVI|nr:protein FAM13C isoform X2 [Nasonia vitripennis]XP_032455162.1 protein FAM13C isoform X2 [Nasonia vitripennis]XP_032455163.1 protein FAM13C isoform X2 [Nasonia vitripennis]
MRGPRQESFEQHLQDRESQQQPEHQKKPSVDNRPDSTVSHQQKDESRLAKVKRAISCSLLGRGSSSSSSNNELSVNIVSSRFGRELELVETHNETGVPYVVYRLCSYLEAYGFHNPALFRLASSSSKLAERLRLAFDRSGDADLEAANCPATAVLLLKRYLKELPSPIVWPVCVSKLVQLHFQTRSKSRERWIDKTRDLLDNELTSRNHRLLGYLILFLGRFEAQHGCTSGVCGIFAPILLPQIPSATVLLRDLLHDAKLIFPDCSSVKEPAVNSVDCKVCIEPKDDFGHPSDIGNTLIVQPTKRKDRRDSSGQERKLIRSNSEEKIWEKSKRVAGDNSNSNTADSIRRVSSHEDFNSAKHLHILLKLQKDMGHGTRHGSLPLQEMTNVSPVSSKASLVNTPGDVVLATEKYDCDAERLRNSERFSRSITPRGRRQVRRRKLHRNSLDQNASKENELEDSEVIFTISSDSNKGQGQSFLEMLSSGPSRSPSPVRPPPSEQEEVNNPTLANWSFQMRQSNDEEMSERVEAMVSPRNSILIPRRFYLDDKSEEQENVPSIKEHGLKNLMKQINSLKKKIKRYEGEFEDNFGYRPSHSDKMSNRDIKRIVSELNKVRKEHKILKEGFVGTLLGGTKLLRDETVGANNNNNGEDMLRANSMTEMVLEVERKLAEKRFKYNRPEDMDDLTYEQLLDEKTAVQKALLHIENAFGRLVSKEDRSIVRPLYDKYRMLKRQLIRAGANRYTDSMSELATILEHEAMDFTSSVGNPIDCDRRASEPDMSHRGILDCIDSTSEEIPTDSDSQHSSSDGSRGVVESLHSLPKEELLQQQLIAKEEKKRLRRSLKELEMQFEARAGRRMQRADRGPRVNMIYDSYKQTKAKLRLISALLAKSA